MCRRTIQGTIGSQPAKGQGWLQIHRTILHDSQPSPTVTLVIINQCTGKQCADARFKARFKARLAVFEIELAAGGVTGPAPFGNLQRHLSLTFRKYPKDSVFFRFFYFSAK